MSQLTEIIVKSGLLRADALTEFKRWGMPLEAQAALVQDQEVKPVQAESSMTVELLKKLCQDIDEAVHGEGYVLMRETDLEAIPQYLRTMREAKLHVVMEDDSASNFTVQVGKTEAGDYIIPWRSDSITDLLTNGQTYLRLDGEKIFFNNAKELFYGNNKAFVVCTPSTREPDGKRG